MSQLCMFRFGTQIFEIGKPLEVTDVGTEPFCKSRDRFNPWNLPFLCSGDRLHAD